MALTPTIINPLAGATVVGTALTPVAQVSLTGATAIVRFPTLFIQNSDVGATVTANLLAPDISVSDVGATVVARGQFDNPKLRAWAYSQDGHDFYVLRLGMEATLVYDATTQQWATWDNGSKPFWRAHLGGNWLGMAKANFIGGATTQVVAADDSAGTLWTLDPTKGADDSNDPALPEVAYTRAVRGGIPFRGRHRSRTNGIWLTISNGNPTISGAKVLLRTSDDQGRSWQDRGYVTVVPADYSQDLYWRSLGLMRSPGRLFEFEDNGAMVRIDGATIDMSKDDQGGDS